MHAAVMSCDYLLAAAFCHPEAIEAKVADLTEHARSARARNEKLVLEGNATAKLIEARLYPCEGLFKNNLGKAEEPIYTAKDIARIVSQILENSEEFDYANQRLWECTQKAVNPECSASSRERVAELNDLIEEVSLYNELESADFSILHFCSDQPLRHTVFNAILNEVEPPGTKPLPYEVKKEVRFYEDYREYLTSICYSEMLIQHPEDRSLLKEGFYWSSLCALKERGKSLQAISPDSFGLGNYFVESMRINQCLPGQKFWNVCLACVVAVLTEDPAYEINVFKKSEKNEEQRGVGDFKAYRSHVTKGGTALRLMFWKDSNGYIELANVGPKNELFIAPPD